MDADQLLLAQAEAVAASSAALANVYLARKDSDPGRWLEIGATELWRFASTRRLLNPPAAAWLILIDQPPDTNPSALGLGIGGCLTDEQRRTFASRVRPLMRVNAGAPGVQEQADLGSGGILRESFGEGDGGTVVVLGGLLRTDGDLDGSVDEDPLIASMFAAIARAAGECIIHPIILRRSMMHRLSPARQRVLVHLVEGLTTTAIGKRLQRSPHTVHDHVLSIFRIFGVNSRHQLIDLWHGRSMRAPHPPHPPSRAAKKDPAPASEIRVRRTLRQRRSRVL